MTMAVHPLFFEFPPVTTEAWEKAIREDLKGADYAEKLVWRSPEGFDVKPYYRAEDLAGLEFLNAPPGDFPYVRGNCPTGDWRIREQIDVADPEDANRTAQSAVAAGAEEIFFCQAAANAFDLALLLAHLDEVPVHFETSEVATVRLLLDRLKSSRREAARSAGLDWTADPDQSAHALADAPPSLVPFTIHVDNFHDSGATAVEEIGLALASGVDFLRHMLHRELDADRSARSITFSFAMGSEFFMQAAKLRAFRLIWAQASQSFGVAREHAKARIYARTSRRNRTISDPHTNALRGTTEAISAIVGGAESIYVAPFDEMLGVRDEPSRRLARNTQIILKQEAFLGRVADLGGGSYYLETLTDSIAAQAWKLFQEIECAGGFRSASGTIAPMLEQRSTEPKMRLSHGA
jgi:methylmalonyl-CoA mutase